MIDTIFLLQGMLMQWICGTNGQIRFTPRGRAWNTADGSTGITQNAAFLALVYGEMDSDLISAGQKSKYVCFSRTQVRATRCQRPQQESFSKRSSASGMSSSQTPCRSPCQAQSCSLRILSLARISCLAHRASSSA